MEIFDSLVPVGIVLLCVAGVIALIALAYLLVTLAKSMKETFEKVNPLMDQAQEALEATKPALDRIDPLLERLTLTVDAANLEIMRVDQILEDVNTITGNVSKATESVNSITSLPLEAVSSVTTRLRNLIAPWGEKENAAGTVAQAVNSKLDDVDSCVAEAQAEADEKRAEVAEAVAKRDAAAAQTNSMSSNVKDSVEVHINIDSEAAQSK